MENNSRYVNQEAERAVLGSLLLDWKKMGLVEGELKEDDFNIYYNQIIFRVMKEMYRSGKACDMLTLKAELEVKELLEKAGGITYIASLCDEVPSSANVMHYVQIVRDCRSARDLRDLSVLTHDDLNSGKDKAVIFDEIEKKILEISSRNCSSKIYDSRKFALEGVEAIRNRKDNFGIVDGVPSGLSQLDEMFSGGFQNGQYYVIGARPSMGKTALVMTMLENMMKAGYNVGIISLEMTAKQLSYRLFSQMTGIAGTRFQTGQINDADLKNVIDAASEMVERNFYITESPDASLTEVKSLARNLVYMKKVQILFIDYLGLIRVDENMEYWMKSRYASRALFELSHELNVPVVTLCQLGRDAEENKPSLKDVRGSSDIVSDADNVVFLHGDRDYSGNDREPFLRRELLIEKNRMGPLGTVPVDFIKQLTKFVDARDEAERGTVTLRS